MSNLLTPCKPWTGRVREDGYGTLGAKMAHRAVWEEANGPIPPGMTLDHLCHDPLVCQLGPLCPHRRCVNLEHLECVTDLENKLRGGAGYPSSNKTHCPANHEYTEENTVIYSGRRHCRICRRIQRQEREAVAKIKACRELGHERVEADGKDGRRYCVICNHRASALATASRWSQLAV